jgi:hypothetical protein
VVRALDQTEDTSACRRRRWSRGARIPALTGHVPRGNPIHLALGAGAPRVALLH